MPHEYGINAPDAMVPSTQTETQIALVGAKRRREITPPFSTQQQASASSKRAGVVDESKTTLEIYNWTGPGASIQEPRKKKRPHDNKAKFACVVCRIKQRKVCIVDSHPSGVVY
jgi:hypothetical protein